MKAVQVVSVTIALAGILLIGLSVPRFTRQMDFIDAASTTRGEITEVARRTGRSFRMGWITNYLYKVRFQTDGGETVEVFSPEGQSTPEYEVGDVVTILYAPDDPRQAAIDAFALLWFDVGVLMVFGGCFLWAGLCGIRIAAGRGTCSRTEFKLSEIRQAFRDGRLTRDSEYQGFLVAITFVGFGILAPTVSVVLFGSTTLRIVLGGILLVVVAQIVNRRRRRPRESR